MTPGRWEPNEVRAKISLDKCLGAGFDLWVKKKKRAREGKHQGLLILLNGKDRDQNLRRLGYVEM